MATWWLAIGEFECVCNLAFGAEVPKYKPVVGDLLAGFLGPSFVTLKMHDSHANQVLISLDVNIELHDVHAFQLIIIMTFMKTKVGPK